MVRGSGLGVLIGILPGAGPAISSFMAYAMEKQIAKDPSRFGKGAIEGLVAPEAANNADAQTAFIPTLTLGVPGDATTAIILAALIIHGITPGPKIITEAPQLFWGLLGELLDRQPDAAGAEPAPDRAVGAASDASPTRSCFPASCCSAPSAS